MEFLAVLKLRGNMKSPIIYSTASGTGKTSLGKSVKKALGENRISLGGLHDESEIRGHRKLILEQCGKNYAGFN